MSVTVTSWWTGGKGLTVEETDTGGMTEITIEMTTDSSTDGGRTMR